MPIGLKSRHLDREVSVAGTRFNQLERLALIGYLRGLPATGRHFKITGARMHVIKDGLIDDEQRLYDFTGLLIQVGVLKGKPAI